MPRAVGRCSIAASLKTEQGTSALIDRIRHDIEQRLESLLAEADKLRKALAAMGGRSESSPAPRPRRTPPATRPRRARPASAARPSVPRASKTGDARRSSPAASVEAPAKSATSSAPRPPALASASQSWLDADRSARRARGWRGDDGRCCCGHDGVLSAERSAERSPGSRRRARSRRPSAGTGSPNAQGRASKPAPSVSHR